MPNTLTLVDLAKARAFADVVAESEAEAADWIRELCDEVESLTRALATARDSEQAALAEAAHASTERDTAVAALVQTLNTISSLIGGLPR